MKCTKNILLSSYLEILSSAKCALSRTDNNKNNEIVGDEAAYLIKLREAISPTPSTWFNVTNMCHWSHVICTTTVAGTRSAEEINLNSMSLKGTLPSGLNNTFPHLKRLILYNNSLNGPLPSLAGLSSLRKVVLSDNNFTSIPHGCFQDLDSLEFLSLDRNTNLTPWTFPTYLTASSALYTLHLATTNLIGSLPDIFDSFPNLRSLNLNGNSLTGKLPRSIAKPNLALLFLEDQEYGGFSGTIEFLSSMTQLAIVNLERNSFEGPIPDLSNCMELHYLLLGGNKLTGEVPPSLMDLSMLWQVSLDNNWLQGPIPLFNSSTIKTNLSVEGNGFCLDHPDPCNHTVTTLLQVAKAFGYPLLLPRTWRGNTPCKGWNFITCDIQGNIRTVNLTNLNLTGAISPAFANLTDLRELYLGGNNLTESIPESLTTLSQLKILDVSNNNLSGIIPLFSPNMELNTAHNAFLVRHSSPTNQAIPAASRTALLWIKLGTLYPHTPN
ncbi:hypothetical protein PIB30_074804 [Stylosanthes scabra]|uniref:Leucine-rich repeat-containing N-terminal plant-type domain-containing protein n=1 Tax=Stylosanthes scabra TaxID=79078 RepID=A0ABU6SPZ5_9FABA|nr:hypothetical protein [Stylosanthes scabra]